MSRFNVIANRIQAKMPTTNSILIGDVDAVTSIMSLMENKLNLHTVIYSGEPFHHSNSVDPLSKFEELKQVSIDKVFIYFSKTLDGLRMEDIIKKHFHSIPVYNFNGPPYVVMYQMGKVGSKTVANSLEHLNIPYSVQYDMHWLNWERVAGRVNKSLNEKYYQSAINLIDKTRYFRDMIKQGKHKSWKFITLVREPISRNISAFFQCKEKFDPEFNKKCKNQTIDVSYLIDEFMNTTYTQDNYSAQDVPERWFDEEIKSVLGIDVYSESFDPAIGYKIYRKNDIDLLLIRLESLNEVASIAMKEFLGIDNFNLKPKNMASQKEYHLVYNDFKKNIQFSDESIRKIYNTKYAKHFYTKEEIEDFKRNWKTN